MRTFLFLTIFLLGNVFPVVSLAQTEPPQFFTLDGRLFTAGSDTDPLLDSNIMMTIQVLDPAKTCVLYEEQQSISTLATNGYFSVRVGSALADPKRTGNDVGNSLVSIFYNSGTVINGDGGCTYTPVAGDERYFRFFITPSTVGATSQLTPDMTLDSVPQAIVAQTLQGLGPSDVFRTSVTSTQAKLDNLLTTNYTALTDLVGGSSTLYLPSTAEGTQLPSTAVDPVAPSPGQVWYNSTSNELKYYNGTTVETLTAGGAGGTVTSIATGAGLTGGPITASGTISIATGGVTNAMLATGIDASKITVGTLPVGVVPTGTDDTKLPLLGGTMTGALDMGTQNVLNTGHITMNAQRTITIGRFTTVEQTALIGTLGAPNAGATWFNSDTGKMMYWTGAAAREISEMTTAGGDITSVVAGTGLTGGALTGDATLNVDIGTSSGQLFTIDTVPNCSTGQKLQMSAGPIYLWSCVSEAVPAMIADADNDTRIRAEATADEDTLRFETAGSERMVIDASGNIGIGTTAPNSRFVLIDGTLRDMSGLQQMPLFNSLQDNTETTGWNEANHFTVNYRPTAAASANIVSLKTSVWPQSASSMAGSTLRGVFAEVTPDPLNSGTVGTTMGVSGFVGNNGSGTITNSYGVNGANWSSYGGAVTNAYGVAGTVGTSTVGTQTMTNARAGYFEVLNGTAGVVTNAYSVQGKLVNSGAITTAYGGYFDMSGAGTIQNGYGLYIGTILGSTAKYGVYQTDATALNYFNGDVGIGTTAPATQLEITGTLKIADGGETCTVAANAGMVRYTAGSLQYCNGAAWQTLGISGAGLTSLNGQTGSTQTFANGSTGLTPAFSSAGNTHTLNIPLASGAGVTSGTITKAEYDSFVAKLSAVAGSPLAAARIWVGDGGGQAAAVLMSGDATLSDAGLLTIANNAVTTSKINAGAVTDVKLASDAVTSAKILDGTIATADIANSAVTNAKIDTVSVSKITSAATEYFTYMPAGTECAPDQVLKWNAVSDRWLCGSDVGVTDHGVLTGLSDDDHTQYALLAGRAGGQNVRGGIAASENLTLESTSHATKGHVILQPTGGFTGVGTTAPEYVLDVRTTTARSQLHVSGTNADSGLYMMGFDADGSYISSGVAHNGTQWVAKSTNASVIGSDDGMIAFFTNTGLTAGNTYTPSERLRITSTGNVGVGTTSASQKLTVAGQIIAAQGNGSAGGYSFVGDAGHDTGMFQNTAGTFELQTQGVARLFADSTGNVGIGTTTPTTTFHVAGGTVIENNYNSAIDSPTILRRSRGTVAAPLIVQNADGLGTLSYRPYDGTSFRETAAIKTVVNGAPVSGTSVPTDLTFGAGSTSAPERMRITSTGLVGIGTTIPAVSLDFNTKTDAVRLPAGTDAQRPAAANGMIRYNTTSNKFEGYENGAWVTLRDLASGGVIGAGAGAVGAPSLSFSGDPNTGFYSNGADIIGVTTNGVNRFNVSSAGLVSSTTGGGLVTTASGTEGAPTFSFSGDSDTGWWRPAADTMAASTGGTERMRISSAGHVGIGTTNPTSRLHVLGNDNEDLLNIGNSLKIQRGMALTTDFAGSQFGSRLIGHESGQFIIDILANDSNDGFHVRAPSVLTTPPSAVDKTLFSIKPDGNVGIGVTSPGRLLHLQRASTHVYADSGSGASGAMPWTASSDTDPVLAISNPGVTSGNAAYLSFTSSEAGSRSNMSYIGSVSTNGGFTPSMVFGVRSTDTTWAERMRISPNGNIGIGTISPTSRLDLSAASTVVTPTADTVASVRVTNANSATANNHSDLLFATEDVGATNVVSSKIIGIHNTHTVGAVTGRMAFLTSNAGTLGEAMRIMESGNVGIGTTVPNHKLQVNGTFDVYNESSWPVVQSSSYITDTNPAYFMLMAARGGNKSAPTFTQSGDSMGNFEARSVGVTSPLSGAGMRVIATENHSVTAMGSELRFKTVPNTTKSPGDRMTITHDGNVGIGTSSPNAKLEVLGSIYSQGQIYNSVPTGEAGVYLSKGDSGVTNTHWGILNTGAGSETANRLAIGVNSTNAFGGMTERLSITNAGNVGIGTTLPLREFHVSSAGANYTGLVLQNTAAGGRRWDLLASSTAGQSGSFSLYDATAAAHRLVVNSTGNVGVGTTNPAYLLDVAGDLRITGTPYRTGGDIAWQVPSDARLKDVTGVYERGLEELMQIDLVRYYYKKNNPVGADSSKEYVGVLAQNVEAVIPEAVSKDPKSSYLSLNTTPIFWSMVNAIQELYRKLTLQSKSLLQVSRDIASVQNNKADKTEVQELRAENKKLKIELEKQKEEAHQLKRRLEKIEKILQKP